MGSWKGRVAIVTGGGGGIGLAIASTIVTAGGAVVVGDLNPERVEDASARLGDRVLCLCGDASSEADVEVLVAAAVEKFGRLDAMFNNAGVGGAFGPITEQSVEAWDETFAINTRSVFLGTKHAARQMIAQGTGGAIVNTSSVAGLSGGGGPQAYSASKAAVIGLTKATAVELAEHRIRVNAVCPGAVYTELLTRGRPEATDGWRAQIQPWPDRGDAAMIADVAVWLASDESRFVTGEAVTADGGVMAATPRFVDHDLAHLRQLTGIAYGNTGRAADVRRLDG